MFKSQRDDDDSIQEPLADSVGKLLIRLTIGGLMLFHGVSKIQGGLGFITAKLEEAGLPALLSYGVYVGEVAAPILIILGLWTRLSSLTLAFTMGMAVFLAHKNDVLALGQHGEWAIETPMLFLLPALAIAIMGPGAIAIGKKRGILA